jgi:putative membrane protein
MDRILTLLVSSIGAISDIMGTMDRIVNTPLPLAYSITINQIAWAYILLLPIQIYPKLHIMTIPATLLAAYVILGLMQIGIEIENPFGDEVSDLPLDSYCQQIQTDIDIIMSKPVPNPEQFMKQVDNMPLYPLYMSGYQDWAGRSKEEIREALKMKMVARMPNQGRATGMDPGAHV